METIIIGKKSEKIIKDDKIIFLSKNNPDVIITKFVATGVIEEKKLECGYQGHNYAFGFAHPELIKEITVRRPYDHSFLKVMVREETICSVDCSAGLPVSEYCPLILSYLNKCLHYPKIEEKTNEFLKMIIFPEMSQEEYDKNHPKKSFLSWLGIKI